MSTVLQVYTTRLIIAVRESRVTFTFMLGAIGLSSPRLTFMPIIWIYVLLCASEEPTSLHRGLTVSVIGSAPMLSVDTDATVSVRIIAGKMARGQRPHLRVVYDVATFCVAAPAPSNALMCNKPIDLLCTLNENRASGHHPQIVKNTDDGRSLARQARARCARVTRCVTCVTCYRAKSLRTWRFFRINDWR